MLEKSADVVSSCQVISLSARAERQTLQKLATIDPDVRGFLKLIRDEELRAEAVRLLEKAIGKSTPTR